MLQAAIDGHTLHHKSRQRSRTQARPGAPIGRVTTAEVLDRYMGYVALLSSWADWLCAVLVYLESIWLWRRAAATRGLVVRLVAFAALLLWVPGSLALPLAVLAIFAYSPTVAACVRARGVRDKTDEGSLARDGNDADAETGSVHSADGGAPGTGRKTSSHSLHSHEAEADASFAGDFARPPAYGGSAPASDASGGIRRRPKPVDEDPRCVACNSPVNKVGANRVVAAAACIRPRRRAAAHTAAPCYHVLRRPVEANRRLPRWLFWLVSEQLFRKRVYCRHCGQQFCARCCSARVPRSMFGATSPAAQRETVPVCIDCSEYLGKQKVLLDQSS